MFVRSTRLNAVLSTMFVVALGACGNLGGCGACGAVQPLPQGGLPATQTIEGGAQIRVTQQGFNKLTAIIPGLLNSQLAGGFCVPQGATGSRPARWDRRRVVPHELRWMRARLQGQRLGQLGDADRHRTTRR